MELQLCHQKLPHQEELGMVLGLTNCLMIRRANCSLSKKSHGSLVMLVVMDNVGLMMTFSQCLDLSILLLFKCVCELSL